MKRFQTAPLGRGVRRFQRQDWIGTYVLCPHCSQMLQVIGADGPTYDAERGDSWWALVLSDGEWARMWEDGKGMPLRPGEQ